MSCSARRLPKRVRSRRTRPRRPRPLVLLADKPATAALAAILADVDDAIYVTSWLGSNADSTTGDFSFGLRGNRVIKGELGPPIGEMNVTGHLIDLFGALMEVGSDNYAYSSTYSPTLVFEGVQFSGA